MKDSTRICILGVFSVIWICKPIPYETLAYRIHQREETVSKVLVVGKGGGRGADSNNFVPMNSISTGSSQDSGQGSSQSFNPNPRLPYSLGGEGGGSGGSSAGDSFDDNNVPPKSKWETDPNYWSNYQYNPDEWKKKKQEELETCLIPEGIQNKARIDELPDSSKFLYNIEIKTARKALKKVWKNPEARKEVLAGLARMDSGELLPRNKKDFKGFKSLKELKFNDIRMIVLPGENGAPDEIVAIFLRSDMERIEKGLKNKYK